MQHTENVEVTKNDIVTNLKSCLQEEMTKELIRKVEMMKNSFYKLLKEEKESSIEGVEKEVIEEETELLVTEMEEVEELDIVAEEKESENDAVVEEFKQLFSTFKEKKETFIESVKKEQVDNAIAKREVIDELKALIEKEEIKALTFEEYKTIQTKWNAIGGLNENDSKELWGEYNFQKEVFYSKISIDRELRALDFAKNLEAKTVLCEKVEALIEEESINKMNDLLQYYHEQWREIGPVGKEQNESIWDRFCEGSRVIHKKRQDFYDELHKQEAINLELKTAICEKAEKAERNFSKRKQWEDASKVVIGFQDEWKKIGRVGKQENEAIWNRFRTACDLFFNAKQVFYKTLEASYKENVKLKVALVQKAQLIKDSENWKEASNSLIAYQKEWKTIGEVSMKDSNRLWNDFRAACDHFFDRKSKFFASRKEEEVKNLELKEALIKEIEAFKCDKEDRKKNMNAVKAFSERNNAIGHVPFNKKDKIYKAYKAGIDAIYESIDLEKNERLILDYKNKFGDISGDGNASEKLKKERNFLNKKLRSLEDDIQSFETNMVLISKSKNADLFRKEVEKNMNKTKKQIEDIKNKLNLLKEMIQS